MELLTRRQVAELLACSVRAVERLSQGRRPQLASIEVPCVGRRWRRRDVERFVQRLADEQVPSYLKVA